MEQPTKDATHYMHSSLEEFLLEVVLVFAAKKVHISAIIWQYGQEGLHTNKQFVAAFRGITVVSAAK